jgi:hypothetical protein
MATHTNTTKLPDRKARRIFVLTINGICILPSCIAAAVTATTTPVAFHAEALS